MKSHNCSDVGSISLPSTAKIGYVIRIRNDTDYPFAVTGPASVTILPGRVVSFTCTTVGWIIERTLNS